MKGLICAFGFIAVVTASGSTRADTFNVQVVPNLPAASATISSLSLPQSAVGTTTYSNGVFTVSVNASAAAFGGIVQGSIPNLYRAPATSPTTTFAGPYLSTENGVIIVNFAAPTSYLGLLWGSLDGTGAAGPNTINFYSTGKLVGSVTADQVYAAAQPPLITNASAYAEINDLNGLFDEIRLSSQTISFEAALLQIRLANVALPEPGSLAILGTILIGAVVKRTRRQA